MPQQRTRRIHRKSFDAGVAGALLRERREALGMSQRALADLAHVSQRTIVNIEFGKGSVTLKNLEAVTHALNLDILTVIGQALR